MGELPDYYAIFLSELAGLIDDAEMSGWDEDGIAHLREADEYFRSDYRIKQQAQREAAERAAAVRNAKSGN
ncbi:hypothetical protein [Sphingopyxis sp.]|uniref:hypothetical protein n=1 Tax=Sphingopyxis sp. TaxID=1908224 RepID=UPI002ED8093A